MQIKKINFITACDYLVKLVRTEASFSQEKMALILGISKKTLVEIEKGRSSLGWTGSVALCAIFHESEILLNQLGDLSVVREIAFDEEEIGYPSVKNNLLWSELKSNDQYIIQQNIVSMHYRIVDKSGRRIASSINLDDIEKIFGE